MTIEELRNELNNKISEGKGDWEVLADEEAVTELFEIESHKELLLL